MALVAVGIHELGSYDAAWRVVGEDGADEVFVFFVVGREGPGVLLVVGKDDLAVEVLHSNKCMYVKIRVCTFRAFLGAHFHFPP